MHDINCRGFDLLKAANSIDAAADCAVSLAEVLMISAMNRPKEHRIDLLVSIAKTANRLDINRLNAFAFKELDMLLLDPDPANRTNLIIRAVPMIRLLKPEEQLRQIIKLYEEACVTEPLRLQALEAIFTATDLLPDTIKSLAWIKKMNQEIYLLRLAQEKNAT